MSTSATSSPAATVSTVALPAALATALGHMQRPIACPEEVRVRIAGLRIVSDEGPAHRSGVPTNWRTGGGSTTAPSAGGSGTDGGSYRSFHAGERRDGGFSGDRRGGRGHYSGGRGGGYSHGGERRDGGSSNRGGAHRTPFSFRGGRGGGHFSTAPRFGNRARTDATVEERMMDRIRDKMNKFCESTYDTTKSWLSELLDSGETNFLTGFITLVFDKAAEESHICPLYARLITELRTGFGHLDTELRRIFNEFLTVFEDAVAAEEPDAGAAGYDSYVALRRRRLLRKGYASFVGEIARLGVLTADDIFEVCSHILSGLETGKRNAEKQGLVEEYADCLKTLVVGCKALLATEVAELYRLGARIGEAKDRTGAPGLSNKARFALMDVEEATAI